MVSTPDTYSGAPGSMNVEQVEKMTMEIAVVGPEIRCHEEPKSAATTGVTMAVYNPYSGGRSAIMAKATPCGSTITAPVNPAMASSRRLWRLHFGSQSRTGNSLSSRSRRNACLRVFLSGASNIGSDHYPCQGLRPGAAETVRRYRATPFR